MDALIEQAAAGGGYLGALLLLFAIPFLNENIAILVGNLFVHEYGMPPSLSVGAVFAGMLASDFSLYAAGRLASRSRWLGERLATDRLRRLRAWIEAHATSLIVLSRILPGLMPPLYLACGVIRLSFRRFALLTLATATIYLPLAFALVWIVGGATLSQFGIWAWAAAILVFSAVAFRRRAGGVWERAMRFSRHGAAAAGRPPPPAPPTGDSHGGMPSLEALGRTIAPAERIPEPLFYLPFALNWLRLALRYGSLSLPTAANPMIKAGGLWGESKTECLDMVSGEARRWIAPYVTLTSQGNDAAERERAEAAMATAGLGFPVVVKPDVGWHGVGVQLLRDAPALVRYLARFPVGLRYMLQQPLDWEGEAGVLYVRRPGEAEGRVLSLTLRYHPHVVGDGTTRLRDLILASERTAWKAGLHLGLEAAHAGVDALERVPGQGEVVRLSFIGSNRVGGLYKDARGEITPALERRFDAISRSMPEFHYGRYDIRFASMERLRQGEEFGIIEINGAGGEAIHVWDPETPVREVFREMMRFQALLFEIGAGNRARGFRPMGLVPLLRCAWRQHRMITRYPPSR